MSVAWRVFGARLNRLCVLPWSTAVMASGGCSMERDDPSFKQLHSAVCGSPDTNEGLFLFSESPSGARALSDRCGPGTPSHPSIVLTPAETNTPSAPKEAELSPSSTSSGADDSPPPSAMVDYLKHTLVELVATREASNSPSTVEVLCRRVVAAYSQLSTIDQKAFFSVLSEQHGVDHECVVKAAGELTRSSDAQLGRHEENLANLLQPIYVWIFKQLGRVEGGVKFLVDMRADLLRLLTSAQEPAAGQLRGLSQTLRELLALWFSVGFLQLERVTWQSPCGMLEKVSEYEAVHPVRNWTDLKRRVGPYRRCFVFTHNAMPREPVVVLHTALTPDISSSIQDIVRKPRRLSLSEYLTGGEDRLPGEEDPSQITTAVFYSISSTQKGLQGIELGNYMIKRVVRELLAEYPHMHQFSSLSPIPGFKSWLVTEINKASRGEVELLTRQELVSLADMFNLLAENKLVVMDQLKRLVNSCGWLEDDGDVAALLRTPLTRLCAQYLYMAKRRGYALDSVANFHLRNGAVMWRLNWAADLTARGLTNSCGMMVNYRYFLEETQHNSEQYLTSQRINASEAVLSLVNQSAQVKSQL